MRWFKSAGKHSLKKEIIILLAVKVVLLWLLWLFCFSNPVPKEQRPLHVNQVILGKPYAAHH